MKTTRSVDTSAWSRENLAWLAGIVEGEGCISISPRQCSLVVQMRDEDVVRRACAIAGCGWVNGPIPNGLKKSGDPCSPMFNWKVSSQRAVYALVAALYEWLGARRRRKADDMFRWYSARPLMFKRS